MGGVGTLGAMSLPRSRTTRRTGGAAAAVLALGLLAACGDDSITSGDDPDTGGRANAPSGAVATGTPEDVATDELAVDEVASGITSPWGVVELDDGDLLVAERDTAEILRVDRGTGEQTTVTTVPGVVTGSESGLLGLAMPPGQDRLLAYYTGEQDARVVSMDWDGDRLGEPEPVLTGIPTGAGYHQGGRLLVGPDELLYVGTGDNGDPASAQDPDSLSGKVLRVTLDGEPAPGNPGGTAVYSSGHRNVQGLALDDEGRLWEAEFGDAAWDEINLVEAGGNYGWPEVEGSGGEDVADEDYLDPAAVWRTGDASPSGLTVWDGSLWLASLRGAILWEVPLPAAAGEPVGQPVSHVAGEYGRLRTVLPAADGGLLLTTSNTDGRGDPGGDDDKVLALTR